RHPAHIEGIYHDGDDDPAYLARMEAAGIPYAKVVEMRSAVEQAIGKMDKASLLKAAESGLIPFLGELAQNDIPKRLFAFRRETVREGYRRLEKVVRSHGVSFGTNAYPPFAVDATGQDYGDFEETCDFVQPLQSYIEFQRLMPIAAWGRYIGQLARLDDVSAIAVSRTLLRLGDAVCPDTIKELDTCGEGDDATIRSILKVEFEMLHQLLPKSYPILPVLRGKDWSRSVIDEYTAEAKRLFGAYVLMGCDYLVPDVPTGSTGWF
ncbi:MAG: hypothetical protein FWH28_09150, partial [Clostridiales bacterium]|nr:hypothetical protein [Clostridiales bacterium]